MSNNPENDIRICIMRNPRSILQVSEEQRTTSLLELAVSKDPTLLGPLEKSVLSNDARIAAIMKNPEIITLLTSPSMNEQLTAVRANGMLLGVIPHASETVQLAAVKQNAAAIQFVHHLKDDMLKKAIAANGMVLYYLPNPSEEIIDFALTISGLNIRYVSPVIETKAMILKALDSPQKDEVIKYLNEVHGGLLWFGRHFQQAISDATQLGMDLTAINNLLLVTLKNMDLEYPDTQLINPWGKTKSNVINYKNLRIGLNVNTGNLEFNDIPVRDFFNNIIGMECNEHEYNLFQCKCQLEKQIEF